MQIWDRLRRRKIVQRGLAYLAVAWAVLEALGFLVDTFGWAPGMIKGATVLLGAGFLIAMILAWYHGEKGHQRPTAVEFVLLGCVGVGGLVAAAAVTLGGGPTEAFESSSSPGLRVTEGQPRSPGGKLKDGWIAVLPFQNLSPDSSQEYFAAGITQEITTVLGRLGGLRVISPGSTARFVGRGDLTMMEIGHLLGVATLLDGSVQVSGNGIRVLAHLVSARTGEQLWEERYDRDLSAGALFEVQSDIADHIGRALRAVQRQEAASGDRPTQDLQAYNAYLQGIHTFNRVDPQGIPAAIDHFQRATRRDPEFALAYAGLADAWLASAHFGMPPHRAFPRGREYAEEAIALDPSLGDAYIALADIKFHYDWEWEEAENAFLRGQELGSAFSTAHWWYAGLLSALGRHDEAIQEVELARELDPLSPIVHIFAGQVYAYAGRYEDAEAAVFRALDLNPGAGYGHATMALALAGQGRIEEATVSAREAARLAPVPYLGLLATVLARAGKTEEARSALRRLEDLAAQLGPDRYVPPYAMAPAHLALGDPDRALDLLEEAADMRDAAFIWVNVNPAFRTLRSHPRFEALVRDMGLEPPLP